MAKRNFEFDEDYKVKNNIDFTTVTACGECCVGCKKKKMVFVKVVQSPMDIVWNGSNLMVAQYINVQESIMCNSVDYVKNFLVNG